MGVRQDPDPHLPQFAWRRSFAHLRATGKGDYEWICSECKKPLPERGETFGYCPYCGASVTEEVGDDQE